MAIRYFKTGASVWNNANNWSATSAAGTDNAGIPTTADDVFFTSGSGSTCAVTTTAGACLSLTTTGYTGAITLNILINVSGNITLGASTTFAGVGALICNASATLTSAGNTTIGCPFSFSGAGNTFTLADNWTFNGLLTTITSSGTITINGSNIFCRGGFSINNAGSSTSLTTGTTVINITNTGTITNSANATGGLGNTFIINAPGSTITLAQTNIYYRTGTFRYIAGTFTGTWNVNITGSCTLDMTNGGSHTLVTPFSLVMQVASTITMSSDWYLTGITIGFLTTINGSSLYSTGTISITTALTGTTTIRLKGSGAGQAFSSTAAIGNDVSFEAGANTVNIASISITPRSGGSSLTYTSGAVNHSGTLTINGPNALTMSTSGMNLNNISITTGSITITLNSLLSATGTVSLLAGIVATFVGTAGFTVGTLSRTDAPTTGTGLNITPGNTYTVTSGLTWYHNTVANFATIKSNSAGSQVVFTLRRGASQTVGNASFTDIDASGGQTIYAWRPGSISNSLNIQSLTPALMQRAATYVN